VPSFITYHYQRLSAFSFSDRHSCKQIAWAYTCLLPIGATIPLKLEGIRLGGILWQAWEREPIMGSRGRAPGQGVRAESLLAFEHPKEAANLSLICTTSDSVNHWYFLSFKLRGEVTNVRAQVINVSMGHTFLFQELQ